MPRASWSRVRSILEGALEHPGTDRESFLASACAGDEDLRAEIEDLLALEREAPGFEPPTRSLDGVHLASNPEVIGPYRIERSLGEGGMGEVYLARRTGPGFEQLVALKLVKLGMDTRELLARFDRERAVLASLRHDAIARLIDAGATESGRPHLVMEYVEGEPIDRWCDERRASVRERVALVRIVCGAVQHAHQNLVLHRDLKPGNILVTADGRPKLLDFGLAKLLPQQDDEAVERTLTGQRLLTPAYASPEQLRGETVGVASDVYSLGIVLYELLAGERPFDARRGLLTAGDEQAERPSTRVRGKTRVAELRRCQPHRLKSELAGDIDTILLKALHPEIRLRYPTVDAFERDLGRYLDGLPVEARPDTWSYRTAKFIGRHHVAVVAAAIVLAVLLTSGWWAVNSYRRVLASEQFAGKQRNLADERRRRVEAREADLRRLAVRLMTEVHDAVQGLPGAIGPRETILNLSLEALQSFFSSENAGTDELLEGANVFLRLARVQSTGTTAHRGDPERTAESLCRAIELADRALALDSRALPAHRVLADIHAECAMSALSRGDFEGAEFETGRSLDEAIFGGRSTDLIQWLRLRANAAAREGEIALEKRAYDEALTTLSEADRLAEEWSVLDPGEQSFAVSSRTHDDLARVLRLRGESELALVQADQSLELMRAVSELRPQDRFTALDYCVALVRNSLVRCDLKRYDEGVALAQEATAVSTRILALDPSDMEARTGSAGAWTQLGLAQLLGAESANSLEPLARALELYASLAEGLPGDLMAQRRYAIAEQYMGSALLWNDRFEDGLESYAAAIERMETIAVSASDPLPSKEDVLGFRANLICVLDHLAFADDGSVRAASAFRACDETCRDLFADVEQLGGEERLPLAVRGSMPLLLAIREKCRAAGPPEH